MKKLILAAGLGLLAGLGIALIRKHLDTILENLYGQSPWPQVPQEDEPVVHHTGLAFDVPRHRGRAGSVGHGEVV